MNQTLKQFMNARDGVASVAEMADLFKVDEGYVRGFARVRGLRRVGSTYVFIEATAAELAARVKQDHGEERVGGLDVGEEDGAPSRAYSLVEIVERLEALELEVADMRRRATFHTEAP